MLVLSRKPGEQVVLGNNIQLTVVKVRGDRVVLGVTAPQDVAVRRGELAPLVEGPTGACPKPGDRPPPLTVDKILHWADLHFRRTGGWPSQYAGPVADAPWESWEGVDNSLRKGCRGLPGGDSLARLLGRHRGKRKWSR